MPSTTVVIIGAGQAGMAMSRHLSARSIDHVICERGEVAHSWKNERWDSLRLLTPNWMSRLPGHHYTGDDPDGYMTAAQVVEYLERFRTTVEAPILTGTTVRAIRSASDGSHHTVVTDQGWWTARAVVIATGATRNPVVPASAAHLPARVHQLTPNRYRRPSDIDDGRVLIVGASASGAQIAHELAQAGKDVTLAVGSHTRLPRLYRGMDIHWWLNAIGALNERFDTIDDLTKARRRPSLQLVGSPERRDLGLTELQELGVELVGRFAGTMTSALQFNGGLANACADADLKQVRLLDRIDAHISAVGLEADVADASRPAPTPVPTARNTIATSEVGTVIWATGYRPRYPWLDSAHVDRKGGLIHDGGVLGMPGLYVLGLPFTRTRKSNFIDGVGPDAAELAAHLAGHLDRTATAATLSPAA